MMKMKISKLEELESLVLRWAADRDILSESTASQQFMKTIEEFGELVLGINKARTLIIKDGIGDVIVTCIIVQRMVGEDFVFPIYVPKSGNHGVCLDSIRSAVCEAQIRMGTLANYFVGKRAIAGIAFAIGELLRELEFIAESYGLTLEDCLETAWNEIKDRKGKMVKGVFIKEADLPIAPEQATQTN